MHLFALTILIAITSLGCVSQVETSTAPAIVPTAITDLALTNTPLPTGTPRLTPTAVPIPDSMKAEYIDPRRLAADTNAYLRRNVLLQGKALNVTYSDNTWVNLAAQVQGRSEIEAVSVWFVPKEPGILQGDCYRIYGIVYGTEKFRRIIDKVEVQVPSVRAYGWEDAPRGKYDIGCADLALVPATATPPPARAAPTPTSTTAAYVPTRNLVFQQFIDANEAWLIEMKLYLQFLELGDSSYPIDVAAKKYETQVDGLLASLASLGVPAQYRASHECTQRIMRSHKDLALRFSKAKGLDEAKQIMLDSAHLGLETEACVKQWRQDSQS